MALWRTDRHCKVEGTPQTVTCAFHRPGEEYFEKTPDLKLNERLQMDIEVTTKARSRAN